MSVDYSSTDYNSAEFNEHKVLVSLLAKHRIILERQSTPILTKKKYQARVSLTHEFNEICETNLTVGQMERKIHNLKWRLKKKNLKNTSRSKQLPFLDWEQKFLDLWVGNGITDTKENLSSVENELTDKMQDEVLPDSGNIKTEPNDDDGLCHVYVYPPPNGENESKDKTPGGILPDALRIKPEPDEEECLYDVYVCPPSDTEAPTSSWKLEPEIEISDDECGTLPLDELKRVVLLAQLRTLKAQESAAKAKEKVEMFKLSILQQNERVGGTLEYQTIHITQ